MQYRSFGHARVLGIFFTITYLKDLFGSFLIYLTFLVNQYLNGMTVANLLLFFFTLSVLNGPVKCPQIICFISVLS